MKIVIDIPEEYKKLFDNGEANGSVRKSILLAVANGTPLPKGHGRLIDCERLQEVFRRNVVGYADFKQLFDIAPTIIPAESEDKE